MRKPFYKASHKSWYWKNEAGKMIRLGSTEHEAYTEWERVRNAPVDGAPPAVAVSPSSPSPGLAPPPATECNLTVAALIDTYLEWVGRGSKRKKKDAVRTVRLEGIQTGPRRGGIPEWRISHDELKRYQNEGLREPEFRYRHPK